MKNLPNEVKTYFFLLGGILGFVIGTVIMSMASLMNQIAPGIIISMLLAVIGYLIFLKTTDQHRALLEEWGVVEEP